MEFFSTKICHKFIVTTLCTVDWNVRLLLSSKGLDLITMRKCYILHNPEICLVSMSSTFTLKKHTNFATTGLCFTWRKFIFLTTKTVHNFRAQLFMIVHYLVWSENYFKFHLKFHLLFTCVIRTVHLFKYKTFFFSSSGYDEWFALKWALKW